MKLEDAVSWEIGTEVVITPSERHAEEIRRVAALEDGGKTIRLDANLSREHLGIWRPGMLVNLVENRWFCLDFI